MNLEKLYVGQEIKNYKEMCKLLDENEKTGQSRQIQISDWERFFSYEKDGQKYIISDIFTTPIEKINLTGKSEGSRGNRSIYIKYIETVILHKLAKETNNTLLCKKNYLLLYLGMVDNRYTDKKARKSLIDSKAFKDYEIHEFDNRAFSILDRILFSALNSLQNRFLINWNQELHYTIYDEDTKEMKDKEATDQEEIEYTAIKYDIAKQMGEDEGKPEKYDKLRDIFFYRKSEDFYERLNDRLFDEFGWQSSYIGYKIKFKKENVIDAIPRTEKQLSELIKKNQHDLNDKVIEAINNNAKSKFENLTIKYDDEYNQLCIINNTDYIPKEAIKAYKPPYNYIERQKLLAEELIRLRERKINNRQIKSCRISNV